MKRITAIEIESDSYLLQERQREYRRFREFQEVIECYSKVGIPALGLRYSDFVENIGVEPMTSSMPWKRSSQLS